MDHQSHFGEAEPARGEPLEAGAAMQLGMLLFAFSRLDLAVQLYLDGIGGAAPPAETGTRRLLAYADALPDRALRADFVQWIVRMHRLVPLQQALHQCRWLPDPRRGVVACVAPPGGPRPPQATYTLKELGDALAALRALFADLQRLCAAERNISPASAADFLTTQPIAVYEQA